MSYMSPFHDTRTLVKMAVNFPSYFSSDCWNFTWTFGLVAMTTVLHTYILCY